MLTRKTSKTILYLTIAALVLSACGPGQFLGPTLTPTPSPTPTSTPTPIPSPTLIPSPTPIPSPTLIPLLSEPISVDKDFENAVRASLLSLNSDLRIHSFVDHPVAGIVVWVEDRKHPDVMFCGAPIHISGIGSILILTTTNLYDGMKSEGILSGKRGCVVVSLQNGRDQIEQLLRYEYGIYSLMEQGMDFADPDTMDSAVKRAIKPYEGQPLPAEMQITLAVMSGHDLGKTSVKLECPRDPSQHCAANYKYYFTGAEFTLKDDAVKRIPLAYAESMSLIGTGARFLFTGRGLTLKENAPEKSPLRTEPYTQQEALSIYLSEMWRYYAYYSARIAGMGYIAPNYNGEMNPDNAYTARLNLFIGMPIPSLRLGNTEQKSVNDYLSGKTETYPFNAMEKQLTVDRSILPNILPQVIVIEEK